MWWRTNEFISKVFCPGPNTKANAQILPSLRNKNDLLMYISLPVRFITPHGRRRPSMLYRTWWHGCCRTVSVKKFNRDTFSLWNKSRETLLSASWFLQAEWSILHPCFKRNSWISVWIKEWEGHLLRTFYAPETIVLIFFSVVTTIGPTSTVAGRVSCGC